jgi:hypothetical protein
MRDRPDQVVFQQERFATAEHYELEAAEIAGSFGYPVDDGVAVKAAAQARARFEAALRARCGALVSADDRHARGSDLEVHGRALMTCIH